MRRAIIAALAALSLSGCASTIAAYKSALDLTPAQKANLDALAQAGKTIVQTATGLYCAFEPTTTQIVRVFDPSKGTAAGTAKVDQATAIACNAALSAKGI